MKGDRIRVRLDDRGFELFRNGTLDFRVNWADLRGIAAYKRDRFTVDEICFGFRDSNANEYWEVPESARGWDKLVNEIKLRYPDYLAEWWGSVALPPFATSWTIVWGDAPEPAECPACRADIAGVTTDRCPHCNAVLATERCSDCKGRGFHDARKWQCWLGATLLLLGVSALGVVVALGITSESRSPLRGIGAGLATGGALYLVFSLFERPTTCLRCEGTGLLDPRGRAMRKATEGARNDG